jgi:hypothetical protein
MKFRNRTILAVAMILFGSYGLVAAEETNEEYTAPVFGALWFNCQIQTDREDRTVKLLNMKVSAAKFPDIDEADVLKLSEFLVDGDPVFEEIKDTH